MMEQLVRRVRRARQAIAPGRRAWRGAAWGAMAVPAVFLLVAAFSLFGRTDITWFLAGTPLVMASFALAGGLVVLILRALQAIPAFYSWAVVTAVLVLAYMVLVAMSVSIGILSVGLGLVALASLVGAAIAVLVRACGSPLSRPRRAIAAGGLVLGLIGLVAGGAWLLDAGSTPPGSLNAAAGAGDRAEPLALPDPSRPGPYSVGTLFYGSGDDRRRPEYGADVDLHTQPVDGALLVEGWSPLRTAYWGFGPEALPLNGRVWYPVPAAGETREAAGPFPLVLILHGQHPMDEYSDPGYAYLGELLASRGFVAASVDQNFLNLSPLVDLLMFQSLTDADDLRGWLLLEHLRAWRDWNDSPGSPFYRMLDLDRVALIGHSRGGQAVAVAAAFNGLPCYPDDASLSFDYGFGIRSVVAFAPVDGSYRPAQQEITLENVNYLVLHGAHDMDVFTFQGSRQYSRVRFSGGDWFKAAVYIYGANHGQFNTVWGRKDLFEPIMRVFNLEQLMPGEEQRQVARVTVGAFLEATLRDEPGYRALFQNLARGRAWLPDTIYLAQYQDAATQIVCGYEEDVDLASTTLPGGMLAGENLAVWREGPVPAKWQTLGDQVVYLGWDAEAGQAVPSYEIRLPQQGPSLTAESVLVLAMADTGQDPTPGRNSPEDARVPIDLTLEVVDGAGQAAHLALSHVSPLQPPLEGHLGKARFMSPFPASEPVLQHFEFLLADFVAANPAFDPARLARVRFVFDRTAAGVVVVDNVGFRAPTP